MLESALVGQMQQELRAHGAYVQKNHGSPFQRVGRPDLEGCLWGMFFAIEVKLPGKKPTAAQKRTLEEVYQAGGHSGVLRSIEELRDFLRLFPTRDCRRCLKRMAKPLAALCDECEPK